MERRTFLLSTGLVLLTGRARGKRAPRPNILFAIADDQSFAHTGAMGDPVVRTPTFDRVAREGVLFTRAYCSSPSCTPSRGAILTGQAFWRLEQGANLWSTLPAKFPVYTELLEAAGYHVGFTRKGWGPGNAEAGGRTRNPAGPRFRDFETFLDGSTEAAPFCFWFGSTDPHRNYERGSGVRAGKRLDDVRVPAFLPDVPEIRSDVADYCVEIERFDTQLGQMLEVLEKRGELDNTLVVVTSDNGMPFPRAKANLYDYGTHMPLAVRWPEAVPGGRVVHDFISFTDFAPTFLEAAGLVPPAEMTGSSLLDLLTSTKAGRVDPKRDHVVCGRERHAWVRPGGLGYPSRALRTADFLYIRNFEPGRWPAGDPEWYGDCDITNRYAPSKGYMLEHRDEPQVRDLFALAFGKRPAEELYDLAADPYEMSNVAALDTYADTKARLRAQLDGYLTETGDPRMTAAPPPFDEYEYYGGQPLFPPEQSEKGTQ